MNIQEYRIIVRDRDGAVKSQILSTSPGNPLVDCEFGLERNGGCGAFSMSLIKEHLQGSIVAGNLVTVDVTTDETALTRYYMGVIITVPGASTSRVGTYAAEGLWFQAGRQTLTKYHEGADIDEVVASILAEYSEEMITLANDRDFNASVGNWYSLVGGQPTHAGGGIQIALLTNAPLDYIALPTANYPNMEDHTSYRLKLDVVGISAGETIAARFGWSNVVGLFTAAGANQTIDFTGVAGETFYLSLTGTTKFMILDNISITELQTGIAQPNSDILPATDNITVAAAYTLGDLEAEDETATSIIKMLAEVQGDIQYGVNQNGELYFQDLSTTDNAHFWVGVDVDEFSIEKLSDDAVNRIYIKAKELIGGGALTLVRDDTTSTTKIANIGIRDAIISIPHLADPDDVWEYAEHYLDDHGEQEVCAVKPSGFVEFIFPRGNARVTELDATEHSLPIQSVSYSLNPTVGLIGTMTIGDTPVPTEETEVSRVLNEIKLAKNNAVSLTKIEHTDGEEWRQEAIVDGRENGLLNHYHKTFKNLKTLDLDASVSIDHNKSFEYIGATLNADVDRDCTIYSVDIPIGQNPSEARGHAFFEMYGRLLFNEESDHGDYWDDGGAGGVWEIKDGFPRLEETSVTGGLYYLPRDWTTWPAHFTVGFKITGVQTADVSTKASFSWDWQSGTVRRYIEWWYAAPNLRVDLVEVSGGAPSVIDSATISSATKDVYYFHVEVHPNGTDTVVKIYSGDENGILEDTIQGNMDSTSGRFMVFKDFYNAVPGASGGLVYFDVIDMASGTSPAIEIKASQDGGTTWSAAHDLTGDYGKISEHFDITPGGAGSTLKLRAHIKWPARLYGWGLSSKN